MRWQYTALSLLGVVFLFIETAYFGFNWTAQSHAERVCDIVGAGCVVLGVGMNISALAGRLDMFLRTQEEQQKGK